MKQPAKPSVLHSPARKVAFAGILGAQAIAIAALELLIPPLPFLPPGAKPGFSNIVTMFAAKELGLLPALGVMGLKSGFVLLTRGPSAFLMSFFGGLLSTLAMSVCLRWFSRLLGSVGISVIGAVCHNAGQLLAACVLTGSAAVLAYWPALALFAGATGVITGILLYALLPALEKQRRFLSTGIHP